MSKFFSLSIFAYFLGSIVFGHIVAKIKKVDLSKIGSKSYTSTNVSRAFGWRWGILTALLDFSKGTIPTLLALNYLQNEWQIVVVAILPTLGHIFPVLFKFKGGKGGATFLGTCLALVGLKTFIPAFLVWLLIFALTRITAFTNLIFPWLFSLFLYYWNFPFYYFMIGVLDSTLITFALRSNIKRFFKGKEPKTPLKL
ncbi:MAG: glycerol-3-phosphate acyltransferase [Candidatus Nealsonbacteria bacterium]|nr:MAG: glycerol-3-phosphate acyltransferase [Candidatus Nealsonbacteria bacterium]